jgi:thiamine-phosphate pyrophosphorylase
MTPPASAPRPSRAQTTPLSPIFAVPGKGAPLGFAALAETCAAAPIPVVALGGITPALAPACLRAGASAVAAIRAAWEAQDRSRLFSTAPDSP